MVVLGVEVHVLSLLATLRALRETPNVPANWQGLFTGPRQLVHNDTRAMVLLVGATAEIYFGTVVAAHTSERTLRRNSSHILSRRR